MECVAHLLHDGQQETHEEHESELELEEDESNEGNMKTRSEKKNDLLLVVHVTLRHPHS